MRKSWVSTSALAVFMLSNPVMAQDTAAEGTAAETGLDEIVVTAQRKVESLQKAAIAIDAVSADDLTQRGVTTAADLGKVAPAIRINQGGGNNTSIFLRGVGNMTNSNWVDPAVAPNYDGVVIGRAAGAFGASFYDLQRVEVLKGPQGILYGRNATGGTFNVIPNRPELGENTAGATFSYGNYDAVDTNGYMNIATGDTSALRIAGMYQQHDGYNRDGADDLDRWGVRAQFLIEPSSDLSIRLAADYTHIGGKGPGESYLGSFVPTGANSFAFTAAPANLTVSEGMNTAAANAYRMTNLGAPGFGFLTAMQTAQSLDYDYYGVNAEVKIKTGVGEITIIPAYRKSKGTGYWYGPSFNTGLNIDDIEQYSLEARLSGSTGAVDYVVGTFYYDETIDGIGQFNQEFVQPFADYVHKTDSWAAFGQLKYNVSDRLRLVGGLRYTRDHKTIDGIINNFVTFCGGIPATPPPASFGVGCQLDGALPRYPNASNPITTFDWLKSNGWIPADSVYSPTTQVFPITTGAGLILKTHVPVVQDVNFSRVTWKVGAEFDVAPDNLLYATVESGYRAGGLQMSEGSQVYQPEFITAYSIGSKNRFLDNRLQINVEAFWWEYRDQQITYFTIEPVSSTLINATQNVGKSRIRGLDFDIMGKVTNTTTLSAQVQYLDTQYKQLTLLSAAPFNNINCPSTATGDTLNDGTPVFAYNCSGNDLLFSPKWSVNLGVEQIVPINDALELQINASTSWRDTQNGGFEFLEFQTIPAYWTSDAQLSLRNPEGKWSLSAFVNNIENERRISRPQSSPIGFASASYTAPRTYGLRLSAKY